MRDETEDPIFTVVSLDNAFADVKHETMRIMKAMFATQWPQINQHKSVMSVGQHHKKLTVMRLNSWHNRNTLASHLGSAWFESQPRHRLL